MTEKIAKLWAMLQEFRDRSAAIKAASMMKKMELAQDFTEHEGDLIKALISTIAYQAAAIEKLEQAFNELKEAIA